MDSRFTDFSQIVSESACAMLNDPKVVSDLLLAKALERGRTKAISLQDAKEFVKDYLKVLCERR
jgi:hypothetical protein